MINYITWFIGISGFIVATQANSAMDFEDMDISPTPPNRIYNLRPSSESQSFQWIKSQAVPQRYKSLRPMPLPEKYDFRKNIPYIHDQGYLGSCTAQAITLSMEYILKKSAPATYRPLSPLFVYYNERAIEGTIPHDAGAVIADGIAAVCKQGACEERMWTYSDNKVKFKQKPSAPAYKDALKSMNLDDIRHSNLPQDLRALKETLAQGIPIIFGINVYASFESLPVEQTGKVPMPKRGERKLGGHAMTLVGYNDVKKIFYFANSWGTSWGKKGFGTIPYDYIMDKRLTDPDDFWKIESVGPKI